MKGSRILVWSVQILLGILFLWASRAKLLGLPVAVEMFRDFGYPDHFYLLVGMIEFVSAVLLFVPLLAGYGAIALGVVMIGAAVTHGFQHEPGKCFFAIAIFVMLLYVIRRRLPVFMRRDDLAS